MKRPKRDWLQIVEDQTSSGKSVEEYCEEIGIHPNTSYKNRKAQRHPAMVEIRPMRSNEITAVVVNVGQYSVAIRSGFDPMVLKSVLEVSGQLQ